MIEVKAPNKVRSIFLAGSIEQDTADRWQDRVVNQFKNSNVIIYNPRRAEWDDSWDHDSDEFHEQVSWEIDHILSCDQVLFYFDPDTKSPISLLELGLLCGIAPEKVIVCCPEAYWRYGNVRFMCEKYLIPLHHNLYNAVDAITI